MITQRYSKNMQLLLKSWRRLLTLTWKKPCQIMKLKSVVGSGGVKMKNKAKRKDQKSFLNAWVKSNIAIRRDGPNVYSYIVTETMIRGSVSMSIFWKTVSLKTLFLSNIFKNIWNKFLQNKTRFLLFWWASTVPSILENISKVQTKYFY